MSRRATLILRMVVAMLAWGALLSLFAHERYLHRPRVPDEAYRETTSIVQNFGGMLGILAIGAVTQRAIRLERPVSG